MLIIPVTGEAEIRRVMVLGQPRQKVSETLVSINNLGIGVHNYVSYAEDIGRSFTVPSWPE
jgi:hypothetical protein